MRQEVTRHRTVRIGGNVPIVAAMHVIAVAVHGVQMAGFDRRQLLGQTLGWNGPVQHGTVGGSG